MRRGVALLFAVVLGSTLGATVTSCAAADESVSAVRTITVKPRLVVDGTIALADRSANIAINSLVAHANEARVLGDNDVVAAEEAGVVFNFAADGSNHSEARAWSVPVDGGTVAVEFGPADSDVAATDSSLVSLVGHTAIIEGTITIATGTFGAFGEVDPDGTPAEPVAPAAEVDPDGTPAIPDDVDTSEVDPDGTPAIPDDVDSTSEVDPDGTPAIPDDVDGTSEVDPDGTPAEPSSDTSEVDPDGTPARPRGEVDPDGTPARPHGFDALKAVRARVAAQKKSRASGQSSGGSVVVPFTLVVDGAFAQRVALSASDVAGVGADELLPIDLRVDVSTLLTSARVATLETLARSAITAGVQRQGLVLAVPAATTAQAVAVDVPAAEAIVDAPVVGEMMVVGSTH